MSRHGCTEKTANILKEYIKDDVTITKLGNNPSPDITKYNTIIIGGSIHAGNIQNKIKRFCNNNLSFLLNKRIGLFLCCMEKGQTAQKQFDEAYPEQLRNHAAASGLFGGEFDFSKMNLFEKAIIKKIANITESISRLNKQAITEFAEKLKNKGKS